MKNISTVAGFVHVDGEEVVGRSYDPYQVSKQESSHPLVVYFYQHTWKMMIAVGLMPVVAVCFGHGIEEYLFPWIGGW